MSKVQLVPEMQEVDFETVGERIEFAVPQIAGHQLALRAAAIARHPYGGVPIILACRIAQCGGLAHCARPAV